MRKSDNNIPFYECATTGINNDARNKVRAEAERRNKAAGKADSDLDDQIKEAVQRITKDIEADG